MLVVNFYKNEIHRSLFRLGVTQGDGKKRRDVNCNETGEGAREEKKMTVIEKEPRVPARTLAETGTAVAKVIKDFSPRLPDELRVRKGEYVRIIGPDEQDNAWLQVSRIGERKTSQGCVPLNVKFL